MFGRFCYQSVVVIVDAKVKHHLKQIRKIEQGKVDTICLRPKRILHTSVDTQYPKGFNQQIQQQQKADVGDKIFAHFFVDVLKIVIIASNSTLAAHFYSKVILFRKTSTLILFIGKTQLF